MSGKILNGEKSKYRLIRPVGQGGVATVHSCLDLASGSTLAVKMLHGERFPITDTAALRLVLESHASTTGINSKYVVRGMDKGTYNNQPFLVLEWMPGPSLDRVIEAGAYDSEHAVKWICQILKGFIDIMNSGYVHRDIKPNNILLDEEHNAKICDLGIAKNIDNQEFLTIPADQMGSLLYISSNQRQDPASATHKDDFYSVCLVLYEIATKSRIHLGFRALEDVQPDLIPLDLCTLIDEGIRSNDNWQDVLAEMGRLLDLNNETLSTGYHGSTWCPDRVLVPLLLNARALTATTSNHPSHSLIDQVGDDLRAGFIAAARRIRRSGIYVSINEEFHDEYTLYISVKFPPDLDEEIERLGMDSEFYGRGYAFICFKVDDDSSIGIDIISGKRLYPDLSYLPAGWENWRLADNMAPNRQFLRSLGEGLALGSAVGMFDWYEACIEEGTRDEESDEHA